MARLPTPGGDEGIWGQILNDYLSQAHAADGSLKPGSVSKGDIGLGNVDNTSDASKPISTATQAALSDKLDVSAVDASVAARIEDSGSATASALLASYASVITPEAFGAVGDGVTDDTAAIQAALTAAGSGLVSRTVLFGPKDYLITKPATEATNFHSLTVPTGVRLVGAGRTKTRLMLPASMTGATSGNVFILLRLGDGDAGVSDVTIEDIGFVGRNSTKGFPAGFGSQIAIAATHNLTKTATSSRVRVRRCDFNDWQQAVRCSKSGGDGVEDSTARLGAQFTDWRVEDCSGDTFGNKVVEFSECNGGVITRNRFTRVTDGPQAIFFSRNVEISYNYVTYLGSGINVTAGSHDIDIIGNIVEDDPSISGTNPNAALMIRSEPTSGRNYEIYNVRSRGNIYRKLNSSFPRAFRFGTRSEPTSEMYRDLTFDGDTFDGDVVTYALSDAAHTKIKRLTFRGCTIKTLATTPYATSAAWDIEFKNCNFVDAAPSLRGTQHRFLGCRWAATPIVTSDASGTVVQNNVWPTTLSDSGTATTANGNVVAASPEDAVKALGSVVAVFDADSLSGADGSDVTSWAPDAGGSEAGALTPRTSTHPTLVTAAVNGHKAVRNGSAARLYTASAWGTSRSQPLTVLTVFKADSDTGAVQNVWAGLSTTQPRGQVQATDVYAVGGSNSEQPVSNGSAITYGNFHVAASVFGTAATKMFFDSTSKRTGPASTNNAMTGLSLFSTGSGNSPYLVGEIAYFAVIAKEATDAEVIGCMNYLAAKYGITLT